VKLEAWAVEITVGSREEPGRKACDKRHPYRIIIIIIIIIITILWQVYYTIDLPIATNQIHLCLTKHQTSTLNSCNNSSSHNLHSTITERLQKYTDLKEQLIRIWQMKTAYILPLVLSTVGIAPDKLDESLKLLILRPSLYIVIQKAQFWVPDDGRKTRLKHVERLTEKNWETPHLVGCTLRKY